MNDIDVKSIRQKAKLTQQQLADKLGVHRITVVKWEQREHRPSQLALRQLAKMEKQVKERKI